MRTNTAGKSLSETADARFSQPLIAGRVDGLGERFTTTEASGARVELLRFRQELTVAPEFEQALRARSTLLTGVAQPRCVKVHDIVHDGGRLTMVSGAPEGQRLSEVIAGPLPNRLRPAFAARLVRDVTAALAALEGAGPDVTHGLLTADRIFVSADGQVSINEQVLAPALEHMALWPEELWLQFGLLAPAADDGGALFDQRTSVMQLAAIALAVLLKRPVSLHDFEQRLPTLIEEAVGIDTGTPSALTAPLRTWLERALLDQPGSYDTATQAHADIGKLLAGAGATAAAELAVPVPSSGGRARRQRTEPLAVPALAAPSVERVAEPVAAPPGDEAPVEDVPTGSGSWPRPLIAVAAVLAVIALIEGAVIARLLARAPGVVSVEPAVVIESPQPGDKVLVDGKPVGATPLRLRVTPKMQAIRLEPAPAAPVEAAASAPAVNPNQAALIEQAAARQRSGGVAFSSPIELKVLQGDRVLGSTADGPIVTSAGSHQLDLVNTALGFRTRQTVTVRAGVITPVTITPPTGRISINAQPWAQVLIDNTPVGETPLANVPVALGDHEVVFRHPQLGERREKITVRADAPSRISTTFTRQ